ncbi:MAG: chemoreceptor glutamine deamidase CheD [Nitrospirota bacterium]|nr:chemoreceptor glutamine deamidase CheD [Nitrospirota bacterium]
MIQRHNTRYDRPSCVLVAGDYYATREDIVIETVLGSCIAVCMIDERNGVAGMNHFMLPTNRQPESDAKAGRYGAHAMELLINEMMRLGADRYQLRAKVFGGGNVNKLREGNLRVGDWNTQFALEFLRTEGIPVSAKDVGGETGRRIVLFTVGGAVKLRRLGGSEAASLASAESRYRQSIAERLPKQPEQGDITLF